jgi:hypothetical protein
MFGSGRPGQSGPVLLGICACEGAASVVDVGEQR